MEGIILLIVALGALTAFGAGIILLVLYFRSGREENYQRQEPVRYGNLVQCPRCSYMNPADSAACLNCRLPFTHARQPIPPIAAPTYPTVPPTSAYPAPRPTPPKPAVPHAGAAVPQPARRATTPPPAPMPERTSPAPDVPAVPRPADMPNAWLEGAAGVAQGQRIALVRADTMVGRSTSCDVQIYDPKVSRKHFLIRYGNGAFFLQDQESSRGTFINGERVMAQRLKDGDRIEMGDSELIFRIGS